MVTHQLTAQTAHVHSTGGDKQVLVVHVCVCVCVCVCMCACVCVCSCASTNVTNECRFEGGVMVKYRDEIKVVK